MNDVLCRYKDRKYQECLKLISSLKETDDYLENFLLENCRLVCESYVRIDENDPVKIFKMQKQHYAFFEKVISVGVDSNSIPLQLKLNAIFNFTYWLLFYTDVELGSPEEDEYLSLVNKGLLSVLGRAVMSVTISNSAEKILANLMCLKNLCLHEDYKTILLILELVTVIVMYVVKLKKSSVRDCLGIVTSFIKESEQAAADEYSQLKPTLLDLCKFSLCGSGTLLSNLNSSVIDCLHLLESTFLFLLEDFKGSLKSLQKNLHSSVSSLWNYLVVLNSYELGNWTLCSRFIHKISTLAVHNSFKARILIMLGKLNSIGRRHIEALRQFEHALTFSANCSTVYYYIGQEYGKMGLMDSMVENFEKLVQVIHLKNRGEDFKPNFDGILLEWLHPVNEITPVEAHYALAVSYGLNESFKNAADAFEKVVEYHDGLIWSECSGSRKRVVELPCYLTLLHEASVMNLLLGNLVRAEQISLDAIDRYAARKLPEVRDRQVTLLSKDIGWLERIIQHELLDTDLEPKALPNETLYTEDLLFFFSRNVIGLLILAEIQRIQEVEDYKTTLSDVFSTFSKYLALMHKKGELNEDEKLVLNLVKALAGKTCVRIANVQIKEAKDSSVEKMFQRALSCNKGDRDALCNYYKFLLGAGKNREALKLWNTFSKEKVTITPESLQSFSLRYLLTDKITNRELEKIQREIEEAEIKCVLNKELVM